MPFSQPKGTKSQSHILQDKDHLKRSMTETRNTNADPALVTSHVQKQSLVPPCLFQTPNELLPPSLAKPASSISKRLLIHEVLDEAR